MPRLLSAHSGPSLLPSKAGTKDVHSIDVSHCETLEQLSDLQGRVDSSP